MIRITNLRKDFGSKRAVDINGYAIADGEMLGLVGNNGAGKTTLFRLMLDLLQADQGNVTIDDIDVAHSEGWKLTTGAYIDESFLIDYLTPEEYLTFVGRTYGLSAAQVEERLQPFGRFMNGELLGQGKYIRSLSAGNKQKLGIIAAMIHHPHLLILDEPFNFLDPTSQASIKRILGDYSRASGATVLISSHNLQHTVDLCSRIALMENGVIIRDLPGANDSAERELETYFFGETSEEEGPAEEPLTPIEKPGPDDGAITSTTAHTESVAD